MNVVIEVSEELEARLRRLAQQEGLSIERYILNLAEHSSAPRRHLSGYGRFAHVNATVEDLHRERQEDNRRDEGA